METHCILCEMQNEYIKDKLYILHIAFILQKVKYNLITVLSD